MSRYRRAMVTGSSYFFTVVAYRRQSILCDEVIRNALRASIETVRVTRHFVIDSWVLLPDHLQGTSKNPIIVTIPRYSKKIITYISNICCVQFFTRALSCLEH
ncbi:hypothetical protein [Candidatus Nitrotoga sp. M5]|uniref:hypothetical protein n=1 Tax=Candidatus Nitrotoga sp. M5 TaxID=2890409 RepID=UPI001EF17192|nr:hypothetical protein [Candidatus Nitrotoga sp. M5]CAH1386569.1 hypothetical protein NTGM5_30078 [Candidatus Nitrotoga sp. M5]